MHVSANGYGDVLRFENIYTLIANKRRQICAKNIRLLAPRNSFPPILSQIELKPTLNRARAHKHCEYHGLPTLQVVPLTQVVGPDQPIPPHCPHFSTVP